MTEYDELIDIYDARSAANPAAWATVRFYTELCRSFREEIVELGIGNGRIALEIAKGGQRITGIDISERMLEQCRARAKSLGLMDQLSLQLADIKNFSLPTPAELIILPFRTFGHLLTMEDRLQGLSNVYSQLAPGGYFAFDHYIFNETWARQHNGIPILICRTRHSLTDNDLLIWDTYTYQFNEWRLQCLITVEELTSDGIMIKRSHRSMNFSYIEPDQVKELLCRTGFEIVNLFGSFEKAPFDAQSSKEQIWIVRRPATQQAP
jgi:SAM-dependent methyltransferase